MEDKNIRTIKIILAITSVLLLLVLTHLILIETGNPLFGRSKKIKQENIYLSRKLDTMQVLKQLLDSVINDNLLLKEQVPEAGGTFYEIQIGAFKEFDLEKYNSELIRLKIEKDADLNKYIIARFTSLKKAKTFLADMQRMGITDAFIVAKIDGKRTTVENAIRHSEDEYAGYFRITADPDFFNSSGYTAALIKGDKLLPEKKNSNAAVNATPHSRSDMITNPYNYVVSGLNNDDDLIRYSYYLIIAFMMIILLLIGVLFTNRLNLARVERKRSALKKKFELLLTGIIYIDDEELGDEDWKREKEDLVKYFRTNYLKSNFSKEVLIDEILTLHRNFSGTTATVLQNLYIELGFSKRAIRLLRTEDWSKRAKIIRELAQMDIVEAKDEIKKSLNHLNPALRLEAGIAILQLDKENPFSILDQKAEITQWQQLNLLTAIQKMDNLKIPSFKKWLTSPQESTVLFVLILIEQFKQLDAEEDLIALLDNDFYKIRKQAIVNLGLMEIASADANLIEKYKEENKELRLLILESLGRIASDDAIFFLKRELMNPDHDISLSCAKSLKQSGYEGKAYLSSLGEISEPPLLSIIKHSLDERLSIG